MTEIPEHLLRRARAVREAVDEMKQHIDAPSRDRAVPPRPAPHGAPRATDLLDDMLDQAEVDPSAIARKITEALGELVDGQTLDAVCPFCNGTTAPGRRDQRTLRVRVANPAGGRGQAEPLIVCENPAGCTVLEGEAGMWVRGNPAWPVAEWDWLAQRLNPRRKTA